MHIATHKKLQTKTYHFSRSAGTRNQESQETEIGWALYQLLVEELSKEMEYVYHEKIHMIKCKIAKPYYLYQCLLFPKEITTYTMSILSTRCDASTTSDTTLYILFDSLYI